MYCVRCGVELADSEEVCPLCNTVVFHPDIKRDAEDDLFPKGVGDEVHTVSKRGALFLVTVAFALLGTILILCDIRISGEMSWSGYVIGSLALNYVIVVFPFWFRRANPVIMAPVDFLVLGLFLLYINLKTDGDWFLSFAFPLVGIIGATVTTVIALVKYIRRGYLYIAGGTFIFSGLISMLTEFFVYITFDRQRWFAWSIYPLLAGVVLGVTFIIIAICEPFRAKLEKKFFV